MTHEDPKATTRKDGSPTTEARGYKWADAEDGNFLSLKHGAQSPRVVDAVAEIIADAVIEDAPWLRTRLFSAAVWRYARSEARARLLSNYIFAVAEEHPDKVGSRLWESANGADNTASKMAEALGLTPLSRAKLAALVTSTEVAGEGLKRLTETGREIVRQKRPTAIKAAMEDDEDDA